MATGTTSKQIDKEEDASFVGYFGALGEGMLALGAILAATPVLRADMAWSLSGKLQSYQRES